MSEIYRSRWTVCDDCDTALIVERDDDRGVPDEAEWEAFPDCPVCDSSLGSLYNADPYTQRDAALRQGARLAWSAVAKALMDAADELEASPVAADPVRYIGSPGWLRDKAEHAQDKAVAR